MDHEFTSPQHELEYFRNRTANIDLILIYLPMAGDEDGLHHFANHNHAKNFVKYLFSQSSAHQPNARTPLNLVLKYDSAGGATSSFLDDPRKQTWDYLNSDEFPARFADNDLCDDGVYVLFAVRLPDGRALSNFLHYDADAGEIAIEHPLMVPGVTMQVSESRMQKDISDFVNVGPFGDFEDCTDMDLRRAVDGLVQRVMNRLLGRAHKTIFSVSHLDQQHSNPMYHIHRLARK